MADWQKIGNALSGMGAGFSGQGETWARNQMWQREQDQREAERQRQLREMAAVQDAVQMSYHWDNNQPEAIQRLLDNRIQMIEQLGGDPSDTLDLAARFQNNAPQTMAEIKSNLQGLHAIGRIQLPQAAGADLKAHLEKLFAEEAIKAQFRDTRPDRQKMFEFMQTLSPEQQEQFKTLVPGGVTVNTGLPKVPANYMWNEAGDAVVPIPGGPADPNAGANKRKAVGRAAMIKRAGTTVVQDLGRAAELIPDLFSAGGVAGGNTRAAKGAVRGSPEWRFMKHINSAKSNIGLDRLQQMRENSPTGGALGQVPFQQQQRLEQVYGEVDLGMEIHEIDANIKRIQNIYTNIIYGAPEERALAVQEGRMSQEESDAVDEMYHEIPFDVMGRTKQDAPPAALQYLQQNPGAINDFVEKYGYRPEGF